MRGIRDDNNKIDEEFIKHIHQILMNGIMHNAGVYRTYSVRIAEVKDSTNIYRINIDNRLIIDYY